MMLARSSGSIIERRSSGFTLVEVLMVLAIIAFLITISFAAFANLIVTSKEKATANLINKLNKILIQRKEGFDRISFKAAAKAVVNAPIDAAPLLLQPVLDEQTGEVIARKQRFQFAFPQRVEERSKFNGRDYYSYFVPSATSPRRDYESSALLFLAITEGETFGAAAVDEDAFTTSEIQSVTATINGESVSIKYFVDGWGQPLRFYRWPTSLIKPQQGTNALLFPVQVPDRTYANYLAPGLPTFDSAQPSATGPDQQPGSGQPGESVGWPGSDDPEPLNRDPDDPTMRFGIYFMSMSSNPSMQLRFRRYTRLYFAEATFHSPLIVSAGPDRRLGLYEPNDTTDMGVTDASNMFALARPTSAVQELYDDITNLNLRNKGN